jgi:hypothetical protein
MGQVGVVVMGRALGATRLVTGHQSVERASTAVGRQHGVPLADRHHLARELGKEWSELVLVDLALGEPVGAPCHPGGGDDIGAVTRVVDPAVLVFGLREPASSSPATPR